MSLIKNTTRVLNDTTDLVNAGKNLHNAVLPKHDKHHDIKY